jgi:hypothetical protein
MDVVHGTCRGCWFAIFHHLILEPAGKILPRPDFCQDAAFIAYALDSRLASKEALDAIGNQVMSDEKRRRQNAEERIALARHALLDDGYFTDDQVGDDIAPRITERLAALRETTAIPEKRQEGR